VKFHRLIPILIMPYIALQASTGYSDSDLDGVDDALDLCPDTPFTTLVDKHGCDLNRERRGKLTLQIGANSNYDENYERDTLLNLYMEYAYKEWEISLSTANFNSTNLTTVVDASDDLYLSLGYTFKKEHFTGKLSLGTRFSFLKEEGNSKQNDYYGALDLNYKLNEKQNLFGYYSYTFSSDSDRVDYKNYHTLSIGTGYSPTSTWYTSLSYNYATVYYESGEAFRSLSWYNAYMLTSSAYLSLNYTHGINEDAYDHTLSIAIGAFFE